MIPVQFTYSTGIQREILRNLKLVGSWDTEGKYSEKWSSQPVPMGLSRLEDGCVSYTATFKFDPSFIGREFQWGIRLDAPQQTDIWGIPTEVKRADSSQRHLTFILRDDLKEQRYYLTFCRYLGAQKRFKEKSPKPGIQFSVWAPNATKVETVIGKYENKLQEKNTGYISDDGDGIDISEGDRGAFTMKKDDNGIWWTDLADSRLADFHYWDHKPYMFRVVKDDGKTTAYRTDLFSRCQIGKGRQDPNGQKYTGSYKNLDGSKSCSIVVDPETVTEHFEEPAWPETRFIPEKEFWSNEFDPSRPLPRRPEDFIIYELHVGSLGYGSDRDGDFKDAIQFLDYLVDLGVNAIELLPVLQFDGVDHWGYGTSHPFALEYSSGGRDQLKHLIRECHRRGMAVIMDVVYNHYSFKVERAESHFDSDAPDKDIYYWYEGRPSDYPNPDGGYLDNGSSGRTPRFWEEMIRKWFISSAVALAEEFHIDGFRVDLTQALYASNKRWDVKSQTNIPVPSANEFGKKLLRELNRTIKMIKPQCFLIAEDHSGDACVTDSIDRGGLGFDATWYAAFYHNLIGDGKDEDNAPFARLLYRAGKNENKNLPMNNFAGALAWTGHQKIVYDKSHDEAGNGEKTARNMIVAVNNAPLVDETRRYAESRCRCVSGLSMLSAGTPMFLMGEEIASVNPMPYEDFRKFRDNFAAERSGLGAKMFKFYQDLIRLRLNHSALRSRDIKEIYNHNDNRIIAFLRKDSLSSYLIIASLNVQPFSSGYWISTDQLGGTQWTEIFNSDAQIYGGRNIGNYGMTISSSPSGINVVIPDSGFIVLAKK